MPCDTEFKRDCVAETVGMPDWVPQPEQIPLAYDVCAKTMWVYLCDTGWLIGSRGCEDINLDLVADRCADLKVSISYDLNGCKDEGVITVQQLADIISTCVAPAGVDTNSVSVVDATVSGHRIAHHFDGQGVNVDINETVTEVIPTGNGGFNHVDENGDITTVPGFTSPVPNSISVMSDTVAGHKIAQHQDGNGNTVDINETVTTIIPDGADGFAFTNEVGDVVTIPSAETTTITKAANGVITATHPSNSTVRWGTQVISPTPVVDSEGRNNVVPSNTSGSKVINLSTLGIDATHFTHAEVTVIGRQVINDDPTDPAASLEMQIDSTQFMLTTGRSSAVNRGAFTVQIIGTNILIPWAFFATGPMTLWEQYFEVRLNRLILE